MSSPEQSHVSLCVYSCLEILMSYINVLGMYRHLNTFFPGRCVHCVSIYLFRSGYLYLSIPRCAYNSVSLYLATKKLPAPRTACYSPPPVMQPATAAGGEPSLLKLKTLADNPLHKSRFLTIAKGLTKTDARSLAPSRHNHCPPTTVMLRFFSLVSLPGGSLHSLHSSKSRIVGNVSHPSRTIERIGTLSPFYHLPSAPVVGEKSVCWASGAALTVPGRLVRPFQGILRDFSDSSD